MTDLNYDEFFELSLDLLGIAQNDGYFVKVNLAWEKILGWSREEVTSMPFMELIHPDDRESTRRAGDGLANGISAVNFENRYRHKNGEYRHLVWNATLAPKKDLIYAVGRDVTLSRREANTLVEQRERTKLAQKASKIGFWDWDIPSNRMSWDDEMMRLYGLERAGYDGKYDTWLNMLHEEDRIKAHNAISAALSSTHRLDTRFRARTPDGRVRMLRSIAEVYLDEHGNPRRVLGVNIELTDTDRIREYRDKRLIVEAAPIALLMVNAEGTIIQANQRVADLFGYAIEELRGQSVECLIPNSISEKHAQYRQEYLKAPVARTMGVGRDLFGVHKNRSLIPVEIGLSAIATDDGWAVIAAIADISERKNLLDKLKERERRLSQIVEAAPLALLTVNAEGEIIHANRLITEMFGYARHELSSAKVELLLPGILQEKERQLREDYLKDPTTGNMAPGRDLFGTRKDGSLVHVEIGLSSIPTDEGTVTVVAVSDITERKLFEAEREKLLQELKRSNNELEQFAYIVSHDLRAPLVTIAGFSKKLAEEKTEKNEAERHYLQRILANVNTMEGLINDLLMYSRAARQEIEKKLIPFTEIVEDGMRFLSDQLKEKHAQIVVSKNLPVLKCHREKMQQVLINLLSNALKYSKESEPPRIAIDCNFATDQSSKGAAYTFSIKDNGIGIPKDQHHRIFKMFERVNPREDIKGTGLGLAICKSIVEKHGGKISFDSEPDIGTTFFFSLPAEKQDKQEGKPA